MWSEVAAPSLVLTSPTRRTQQTAGIIGAALGMDPYVASAFVEADFGEWDGLTDEQVEERWPLAIRRWYSDHAYRAPGGESQDDVATRVRAGIARLVEERPGDTIVIASHVIAIRSALGVALGAPASAWMRFRVAPACLTGLRFWSTGQTEVLGVNWTLQDV
jgi:probable phosphoglycerate mutase